MYRDAPSPLSLPSLEALPKADATLEQVIAFAHSVDPTAHFQELWREDYRTNIQSLWERCVQSYKAGVAAPAPPAELLMCLTYDVVLGPYLGVPDPHKLLFLRWLLDGVRDGLRDPARADGLTRC